MCECSVEIECYEKWVALNFCFLWSRSVLDLLASSAPWMPRPINAERIIVTVEGHFVLHLQVHLWKAVKHRLKYKMQLPWSWGKRIGWLFLTWLWSVVKKVENKKNCVSLMLISGVKSESRIIAEEYSLSSRSYSRILWRYATGMWTARSSERSRALLFKIPLWPS